MIKLERYSGLTRPDIKAASRDTKIMYGPKKGKQVTIPTEQVERLESLPGGFDNFRRQQPLNYEAIKHQNLKDAPEGEEKQSSKTFSKDDIESDY